MPRVFHSRMRMKKTQVFLLTGAEKKIFPPVFPYALTHITHPHKTRCISDILTPAAGLSHSNSPTCSRSFSFPDFPFVYRFLRLSLTGLQILSYLTVMSVAYPCPLFFVFIPHFYDSLIYMTYISYIFLHFLLT